MTDFQLVDLKPKPADFRSDVIAGLSAAPKTLPPKYFYDAYGSKLFDDICQLDEYYLTRTEVSILNDNAHSLDELLIYPSSIIEYGSGSSTKIKKLLHSKKIRRYVPIDISKDYLHESAKALSRDFPQLEILAVCADYTDPVALAEIKLKEENNKYIFFPGSTIGNLEPSEALELLKNTKNLIGSRGKIILGIDLLKSEARLNAAYNDAKGVTAAFNLNILNRINHELEGNFQIEKFEHLAVFNHERSRMEMHLRSREKQTVRIGDHSFSFQQAETIHTESSHKYDLDLFEQFVTEAGLKMQMCFKDQNSDFAVVVLGRQTASFEFY